MDVKKIQEEWYNINAPLGRELGYPECCIKEFCNDAPELLKITPMSKEDRDRYKAGCIKGKFTGLIPCSAHAKQILSKKIKIESLITNRSDKFPPFPQYAQY